MQRQPAACSEIMFLEARLCLASILADQGMMPRVDAEASLNHRGRLQWHRFFLGESCAGETDSDEYERDDLCRALPSQHSPTEESL